MSGDSVVVTGVAVRSSIGNSVEEFWQSCLEGVSGIKEITKIDTQRFLTKIAGEVVIPEKLKVNGKNIKGCSSNALLGVDCANELMENSGILPYPKSPLECGIVIGSGLGGIYYSEEAIHRLNGSDERNKIHPLTVPFVDPNSIVSEIARAFNIEGPQFCVTTACSSSNNAISLACQLIRSGRVSRVITGGVEATVKPITFAGFDKLGAMSKRNLTPQSACRPFSNDRDGFVIGEGAGLLMLESEGSATSRGASVLARISGCGMWSSDYHSVKPKPCGSDSARSIGLALEEANLKPKDIDLISAHGTGTKLNDDAECAALEAIFGARFGSIPIVPLKQLTGHALGAAGGIEAVHAVMSLTNQMWTRVGHYSRDDKHSLLINTRASKSMKIQHLLSNSFGFGNNNCSIIFSTA